MERETHVGRRSAIAKPWYFGFRFLGFGITLRGDGRAMAKRRYSFVEL